MNTNYLQELFANRIGGLNYGKDNTVYKFEKIKRAKAEAMHLHPDVPLIDMGVGEPDDMAFPEVIQVLQKEATLHSNRGYSDNSGERLLKAAVKYMKQVYDVDLDPATEILHSIGSKAALSIIPACFINSGDVVITTVPGYPVLATHAEYYGGESYNLPLLEENDFLPDLRSVPTEIAQRTKILVLNYPNNPTGAVATVEFYKEAIQWARENKVIIIQDAAYGALVFEDKPLSILSVPGGKEVALELHSLSKSHNMTGWRIGWVCGNPLLVQAYGDVKNNTDSGQFLAIQNAAAHALEDLSITESIKQKYSRRMDLLVRALNQLGIPAKKSSGTFFLYCKAPKAAEFNDQRIEFENGEAFSQWLIKEHLISTVPWDDAGHYVRFSVTFECTDCSEDELIEEVLLKRLQSVTFCL